MGLKNLEITDSYIIEKYGIENYTHLFRTAFTKGFRKGHKQGIKTCNSKKSKIISSSNSINHEIHLRDIACKELIN